MRPTPAQQQAPPAPPKPPAPPQPKPLAPAMMPTEVPYEKIWGPYEIGLAGRRKSYTVVEHGLKLQWPAASHHAAGSDFDQTMLSYEIRDSAGEVVFHTKEPAVTKAPLNEYGGGFEQTNDISVSVVADKSWRALLIEEGGEPSAPDSCSTNQFFGLVNDRFMPYDAATCETLEFADGQWGAELHLMVDTKSGIEFFHSIEWTGYFHLVVPWRLNFDVGKILPTLWTIHNLASHKPLCEVGVRAERQPQEQEMTFIRLYQEPGEGPPPQHVVVKKESKIEYLSAAESCKFSQYGMPELAPGSGTPGSGLWLHVRVDGKEGWVHEDEDFEALGLQPAG